MTQAVHKVNEHTVTASDTIKLSLVDNISFHFGQSAEDISLLRHFHQKKGGFYVDIGAFHPTKYSNTYLLHKLYGWTGINIDASKEAIDLFNKERPQDVNICTAVGRGARSKTFYEFSSAARNTLSEQNVQRQKIKGDTEITRKVKVKLTPLKKILSEHVPENKTIDVLDVDVEGYEMEVLESNDWSQHRPKLILIEDYAVGEGKLTDSLLYTYLTERGYRFISHHYDTSFYLDESQIDDNDQLPTITRSEFMSNLRAIKLLDGDEKLLQKSEAQDRLKELELQVKALEGQIGELGRYRKQLLELTQSRSWKLTHPLRLAAAHLRKLK